MNDFNPPPRLWLACFGVSVLNWVLDSVVLAMGLLTVGAPVPWKGILISYAAAQVLVEIPITPGGLGLSGRRAGGGADPVPRPGLLATAGTLVYRAGSYWLLLLVGWSAALYLTLRNRRAARRRRSHHPTSLRPALTRRRTLLLESIWIAPAEPQPAGRLGVKTAPRLRSACT